MTKKARVAARRRLYEEAIPRLEAHGFALLLQPDSLSIEATAPCGRAFIVWPTALSWMEKGKGLDQKARKRRRGDTKTFLAEYHNSAAALASEARSWASLRPDLTIFTDAALCPRTGASGWGAWMKGGSPSVSFGGPIADLLKSSSEAEARAAANAFAVARKEGILRPGMVVMWQSDSLTALRWLLADYPLARDRPAKDGVKCGTPKRRTATQAASPGASALAAICRELELRVLTRHVRGHQEGPNRQWVNRLCDEIAGEHMRARRRLHERTQAGHCPRLAAETRP
jgi:ribonuclease HI